MSKQRIRIGCASAFYGDSQLAARQLVDGGKIDYLVFDYLAEATMAILARAKMKDPNLGFAVDFVTVAMKGVLKDCAEKGIKVVANAGGVNVPGCIKALERLCDELGLSLKIAGVYGDDLTDHLPMLREAGLPDMETGQPLPGKLASINAYLGAQPIAEALDAGADVVVTGRVVDSAVVLGPLMHEFGWATDDYDKLAQGSLAGHVIECGAQCTGGNFTDWQLVPDFSNMSYPVADVATDGSFIIDIPPGTGGLVSRGTVGEQILYEIGDPANYLLPDVACDFTDVTLTEVGKDRVEVAGARGRAPGTAYKVCATWIDGYRLMGSFYIAGPRARDKALTNLNAWVGRTRKALKAKQLPDYRQVSIEALGSEEIYGPHARAQDTREVLGKFGLHHDMREALVFAAAEMAYLATSAAPGMSGFGAGRARPQPLMKVHSGLIAKSDVPVTVQLGEEIVSERCYEGAESTPTSHDEVPKVPSIAEKRHLVSVPLEVLAYARSGDKGDHANIGLMAREDRFLPILEEQVTADVVAGYFAHLLDGGVTRYSLPGFGAYNFLLKNALGGGATGSVRTDAQGKAYGQMLLSMPVEVPAEWNLD